MLCTCTVYSVYVVSTYTSSSSLYVFLQDLNTSLSCNYTDINQEVWISKSTDIKSANSAKFKNGVCGHSLAEIFVSSGSLCWLNREHTAEISDWQVDRH